MPNDGDVESAGAPASKEEQRQDRILDGLDTSSDGSWRKAWEKAAEKEQAKDDWLRARLKGGKPATG